MRVHFQLVDAAEGEHGNVKPAQRKDRMFILAASDFIDEVDGEQGKELAIRFEYRPATLADWPDDQRDGKTKPPTQKELTEIAERRVLGSICLPLPPGEGRGEGGSPTTAARTATSVNLAALDPWLTELAKPHVKSDGERADYSRLRAHLNRYVARNTFDYFIHKDLGTFLRRELDVYIKNEVMHLDDVENETVPRVEQYLSKIKVIRRIAGQIIDLLAQLEDFQKKLWLKKKFVVETQYCIAVEIIPDEFLPEIVANDAQWEEWESLHSILSHHVIGLFDAHDEPRSTARLKACPTLMIDTQHFAERFVDGVRSALHEIDENIDGLLLQSENVQALRALRERHRGQVSCVYIDPPYNTAAAAARIGGGTGREAH